MPRARELGPLRVAVHGHTGLVCEIDASSGVYGVHDLAPGSYRVELRAPRFVVARRVRLRPGERGVVDFAMVGSRLAAAAASG
jgi:hypothetical protein